MLRRAGYESRFSALGRGRRARRYVVRCGLRLTVVVCFDAPPPGRGVGRAGSFVARANGIMTKKGHKKRKQSRPIVGWRGAGYALAVIVTGLSCFASPVHAWDARLLWTARSQASGYRVFVRRQGQPFAAGDDVGLLTPSSAGVVSTIVRGLPIGTTVYFTVTSYDETSRDGPQSNELSLRYAQVATVIDSDGDGLTDAEEDLNLNGKVDAGETDPFNRDSDADGLDDGFEVRQLGSNPLSADTDADGSGDAVDNCPTRSNPNQADDDGDLFGNVCDNCSNEFNPDQRDSDGSLGGDVCDPCPADSADRCDRQRSGGISLDDVGGGFSTPDGAVTVQTDAGVLIEPTSVSVTENLADFALPSDRVAMVVDVEPAQATLAAPLHIDVRWDDADNDGFVDGISPPLPESDLKVWLDRSELTAPCGAPQSQSSACGAACCDPQANRWSLSVDGLGRFVLGGASCGNGLLDAFEDCDDGNLVDGDCCSAQCRLEPTGSSCDDADSCTLADACDQGVCYPGFFGRAARTKLRIALKPGASDDVLALRASFPPLELRAPPTETGVAIEVFDRNGGSVYQALVPASKFFNVKNKNKKYKFRDTRSSVPSANGIYKVQVNRDLKQERGKLKVVMRDHDVSPAIMQGEVTAIMRFGATDTGDCMTAERMDCKINTKRKVKRMRCKN